MEVVFKDADGNPCYGLVDKPKAKKMTKKELARAAREAGDKYFYADCKYHGKGVKHLASNMKCGACNREYNKKYYEENKEVISEYKKKYGEENKASISERSKKWYEENKETVLECRKKYREENAAYIFARSTLSRIENDSQEVFSGITKDEAESLCGYSQVEFILHIESTFKEGMSWENRSEWHIDHILPVAWFKEQGITDIKVINALGNLRAEWATDNLSKGAKFLEDGLTEEEFFEMIYELEEEELQHGY